MAKITNEASKVLKLKIDFLFSDKSDNKAALAKRIISIKYVSQYQAILNKG